MKKHSRFALISSCIAVIGLSSCNKIEGGSSFDGTYILQLVEGEVCEKAIGGEIEDPIRTFTIDFKSQTLTQKYSMVSTPYTTPLDLSDGYIWRYLEYYIFFPVRLEFKDGGIVLCTARTYDPELIAFMDDDEVTLSAHYSVKNNIIEFVYFSGSPVSYKIISKSGGELKLEPTTKTLKEYNDGLEDDTKYKMWGMTLWDEMTWTKATFKKQ